jgi:hypothetical protein
MSSDYKFYDSGLKFINTGVRLEIHIVFRLPTSWKYGYFTAYLTCYFHVQQLTVFKVQNRNILAFMGNNYDNLCYGLLKTSKRKPLFYSYNVYQNYNHLIVR